MSVPEVTVIGNLGTDPELRTSPNGTVYVRLFIIASSRVRDRQSGEWVDGDHMAVGAVAFGQLAEHASRSLSKGLRVIAHGRMREGRPLQDGQRGPLELLLDEVGPALGNAVAAVSKTTGQRSGGWNQAPAAPSTSDTTPPTDFGSQSATLGEDPWATESEPAF